MGKKIMRRFQIGEISGVGSPAQKGALAAIMKRAAAPSAEVLDYVAKGAGMSDLPDVVEAYLKRSFTTDQRKTMADRGEAMPGGGFPIASRDDLENAIRAVGRAKDPEKAKSHIIARARALDATSLLPTGWATAKSIGGDLIMEITRVAPRVLPDLLANVVKAEEIEAEITKIADKKVRKQKLSALQVAKSAVVASAWSIVDSTSGEDTASLLRKNFDEYKTHIVGLASNGAETGDEIMLKAIAKSLGLPETATEADIQKALDKQALAAKRAETILKMSGEHAAYMNNDKATMPDGGKEAFCDMSADERDKHMEANPNKKGAVTKEGDDEDDSDGAMKNAIKVDKRNIKRSVVGDDVFAVMKSQQAAIEKGETDRVIGTIQKRAETSMKYVIGKADEVAGILFRIAKGKSTQADADAVEKMLASASDVIGKSDVLTKEFGKVSGSEGGTASDQIAALAAELVKNDKTGKMSIAKARTHVRDTNPALAKAESEERAAARKAA